MAEELWSDEELRIALVAYMGQKAAVEAGAVHSPTQFHRRLSAESLPKRSEGSVGRRMSNISWVLSSSGRLHFTHYAPSLTQAGAGVKTRVLKIYDELTNSAQGGQDIFASTVSALSSGPPLPPPAGSKAPAATTGTVTRFVRSAAVAAWVLQNAEGVCEACKTPAPFKRASGTPYLEIHHLHRLADGGEDTIHNTIAACPNCHRRLHFSGDAPHLANEIRAGLQRPAIQEMSAETAAV